MDIQTSVTSDVVPESVQLAWTLAKQRFIQDLNEDEQRKFTEATPESIYYDATRTHRNYTSRSKLHGFQQSLRPLTDALEQYGKALDIFSNTYPLFLSPIWGSVRIVLLLSQASKNYHERIVSMFGQIGEALPRLRSYLYIFPQDLALRNSIAGAYLSMIEFCTEIKNLFKTERLALTSKLIGKSLVKPLDRCLADTLVKLQVQDKSIQADAHIAYWREQKTARELSQKEAERQKLLAILKRFDHTRKHRILCDARQEGTCHWLLENELYERWCNSWESAGIVVSGIPGCGKSVITSFLIEGRLLSDDIHQPTCYHHCDYADRRTLSLANILASLARQLLEKDDIPKDIATPIKSQMDAQSDFSISVTQKLFAAVCNQLKSVTIFIDGIDELDNFSQTKLVEFLRKIMGEHGCIKTFVSTRKEEFSIKALLTEFMHVDVTSQSLQSDIQHFVQSTVATRRAEELLQIPNDALEDEIVSKLVGGAKDM